MKHITHVCHSLPIVKSMTIRFACRAGLVLVVWSLSVGSVLTISVQAQSISPQSNLQQLDLEPGNTVAFIGNTFAERTLRFGYFETIVCTRFPEHNLTFRNLAWSADTVSLRPRPLNFGDLDTHLGRVRADVIFACFGMAESFDGPQGLNQFESEYDTLIRQLLENQYNGRSAPRLVLVSPIPHESINRYLPDPANHNQNLAAYSEVIEKLASKHQLVYVDLWHQLQGLTNGKAGGPLTMNGIHQTAFGDWIISHVMARELGWLGTPHDQSWDAKQATGKIPLLQETAPQLPLPLPPAGTSIPESFQEYYPRMAVQNLRPGDYELKSQETTLADHSSREWETGVIVDRAPGFAQTEELRQTILEKNREFFYRWRAVNGEYIYGRRKEPFGVISFPPEMKKLDEMIQQLDRTIWYQSHPQPGARFELVPKS